GFHELLSNGGGGAKQELHKALGLSRTYSGELLKECGKAFYRVHTRMLTIPQTPLERFVAALDARLRDEIPEVALVDGLEGGLFVVEEEFHLTDRAVAVLFDEDLRDIVLFILGAVSDHVLAVNEHDDVRVLLDGA